MLYSLEIHTDLHLAKIVVSGDAAITEPDRLRDVLRALTALEIVDLIVDLRDVPRIDIRVAAALSLAGRTLSAQRGSLHIACAQEPVRTTLSKFGVTERVEMFTSTAAAGWPPKRPRPDRARV